MPDFESPPSSSTASDTPADAQAGLDVERQHLIDNIAFLVVRQHRRRQLNQGDSDELDSHPSPSAEKHEKQPIETGRAATTG